MNTWARARKLIKGGGGDLNGIITPVPSGRWLYCLCLGCGLGAVLSRDQMRIGKVDCLWSDCGLGMQGAFCACGLGAR